MSSIQNRVTKLVDQMDMLMALTILIFVVVEDACMVNWKEENKFTCNGVLIALTPKDKK